MEYYEFNKMDNERYLSCYENCMQLSSDLSPYSLLALRDEPVCARRAYDYGLCFHRGYFGGELCYGPPVGDWDAADWEEIFAKEFPSGSVFWGIPELLMKKWVRTFGDSLEVLESRDDWDYVIYTKRMAETKGGKLRNIRRKLYHFRQTYGFEVESLTPELFDEVIKFHEGQTENLLGRTSVQERIFFDSATFYAAINDWDDNHLYGSVFRIDGKICGVLINEIIDESNVVGLYQKQDISYEGLSAYMLVSDCRYLYEQGYLIYNIMADIGSEGLRRSKTMLDPLVMLKKYNIIVK